MRVSVELVKAFTTDKSLGNPAGIVHEADGLSDDQMLAIARHYGFSESAFIQTSTIADFRVRFFSVQEEVNFCGHATVATFFSLLQAGKLLAEDAQSVTVTQETGIGVLPVTCFRDGKIMMTQNPPIFESVLEDKSEVAELLNLQTNQLSKLPIQIVSTGVKKLIVPVTNLAALRHIKPNLKAIIAHGAKHDYSGIATLCTGSFIGQAELATRNFSPSVGIDEDPATGIAAGPLACYADKYLFNGSKKRLIIEQGFDMGKASTIYVDISRDILVGGYAASFGHEQLEI